MNMETFHISDIVHAESSEEPEDLKELLTRAGFAFTREDHADIFKRKQFYGEQNLVYYVQQIMKQGERYSIHVAVTDPVSQQLEGSDYRTDPTQITKKFLDKRLEALLADPVIAGNFCVIETESRDLLYNSQTKNI